MTLNTKHKFKRLRVVQLLQIIGMIIILLPFSLYGQKIIQSTKIQIYDDVHIPMNLNKILGVSLSNEKGNWYNEKSEKVSNIFILPEGGESENYVFHYIVENNNFYCGLEEDNIYEVLIEIMKKVDHNPIQVPLDVTPVQPSCEQKWGEIHIKDYDKELTYITEPKDLALKIDNNGVIKDLAPGEYSIMIKTDTKISNEVIVTINEIPTDCTDCTDLWNKVKVAEFLSVRKQDKLNDKLKITGLADFYNNGCSDNVEILIFNRWGTKVYQKDRYMMEDGDEGLFDGMSDDAIYIRKVRYLPAGVYYYILRSAGMKDKMGFFHIM